jgi:hypothetical protein
MAGGGQTMTRRIIERGTFLIDFGNGEKVVFGNNYKPWWQHATEFIYRNYGSKTMGWRYQDIEGVVKNVQYSNQPFYDDGGLKWCGIKAYQEVIDEVSEKDGIVRVDVADIKFADAPAHKATLTKKLKAY